MPILQLKRIVRLSKTLVSISDGLHIKQHQLKIICTKTRLQKIGECDKRLKTVIYMLYSVKKTSKSTHSHNQKMSRDKQKSEVKMPHEQN